MVFRDSPVTEDELHVYVDGELPADRLSAVEAWLASHPEDAARINAWRAQAEAIRARYSGLAKEPVPERLALDRITRSGRVWTAMAVAASVCAFLVGGVGGWVVRGSSVPVAPSAFDVFTNDALQAHKLYVGEVRHPVEVPGIERQHAEQWLSKRLKYELRVPNLEQINLKLVGARLLPGPTGPAAFFMFEGPTGVRYTLYCGATTAAQTNMLYHGDDLTGAYYWVDRDLAYVMSGPPDRDLLLKVAKTTYDQIEMRTPPVAEKM